MWILGLKGLIGNRKGEPYVTGPGVHGNDLEHWLSHFPY